MIRKLVKGKSEHGFTLVEVLASLTIISIILVGSYNLIVFTNQAAVSNSNRLVAINLGKATMERVKSKPFSYFNPPVEDGSFDPEPLYTAETCEPEDCAHLYKVEVNDRGYVISLKVSQNDVGEYSEAALGLIDVEVTVKLEEENITHQLEGYVSYELEE